MGGRNYQYTFNIGDGSLNTPSKKIEYCSPEPASKKPSITAKMWRHLIWAGWILMVLH
jgi:hypothetical protein